jgi:hypothetical protein
VAHTSLAEVWMADLREFAEIENSFRGAERLLDAAVDRAWPTLTRDGFEVIERSNRSGFDHTGFPNFFWKHLVRLKGAVERGVLLEVEAAWYEPVSLADLPGNVELRASVVVFHHGQSPPLFARTPFSREVPLDTCAGDGLLELVLEGLRQAQAELPDRYRAWLSPS